MAKGGRLPRHAPAGRNPLKHQFFSEVEAFAPQHPPFWRLQTPYSLYRSNFGPKGAEEFLVFVKYDLDLYWNVLKCTEVALAVHICEMANVHGNSINFYVQK